MAKRNKDSKADAGEPEGLQYLNKAWDLRWFLRAASTLLFVDIALANSTDHGLLELKLDPQALMGHAGQLAAALLGFSLVMSLALPVIALMLQRALLMLPWSHTWLNDEQTISREDARAKGYVKLGELRDYAFAERDQFLLNIVEKHEHRLQAERQSDRELAGLLFGTISLAFVDGVWPLFSPSETFLGIARFWGVGGFMLAGGLLWGGWTVLKMFWFSPQPVDWINFRPLAQILAAKEATAKEEILAYKRRSKSTTG